jgi:hypothetical protein
MPRMSAYAASKAHEIFEAEQMGPPKKRPWELRGEDASWRDEHLHLLGSILENRMTSGGIGDARGALEVVEEIYDQSSYGGSWSSMEASS